MVQPCQPLRSRRDARTSTSDSGSSQGFNTSQPFPRRQLRRHVGLVRELGLVEPQDGGGVAGLYFSGQGVDIDVVPLHRHPFERSGIGGGVGRPVVQPRDFRARLGKREDFIFVVGRPAKTTFALRGHDRLDWVSKQTGYVSEYDYGGGDDEWGMHSGGAMCVLTPA